LIGTATAEVSGQQLYRWCKITLPGAWYKCQGENGVSSIRKAGNEKRARIREGRRT
jgi:hypothetical protein